MLWHRCGTVVLEELAVRLLAIPSFLLPAPTAILDAFALLGSLPKAQWLLADRGHDADWFRDALKSMG